MSLDSRVEVTVADAAVSFEFVVENVGDESVELPFRNGMTADVVVLSVGELEGDGAEVWRWSDGRMFTQALRTETLAPGESLTEELTWPDPPAGTYTAEASLAATEVDIVARAAFEV